MNELRVYTFTNFYLSSIQQGIQSAHAVTELFNKYSYPEDHDGELFEGMLRTWALDHKTMVCLNGGDNAAINGLANFMNHSDNLYPWATFHESSDALGGIRTCVAIVLSENIFGTASDIRHGVTMLDYDPVTKTYFAPSRGIRLTQWAVDMIDRLNSTGLAR